MLKEQCWEIQQWHKEKQWLLVCLEEAMEACHVEHIAQKTRREVETKAKKETKRQRLVEEEESRKKLEYIQ